MAVKKNESSAEIVGRNGGDAAADIQAASEFDASGAPIQSVPDVDPGHPAVDANPRANTTVDQNRIDFNDPTVSGQKAVEQALGMKSGDEGSAAVNKGE